MNENTNNTKSWLGSILEDIYNGQGPWNFAVPRVVPSKFHHVLYELPVTLQAPPIPHYNAQPKYWDNDHVRMPHSPENLFIVKENGEENIVERWKLIKETLSKPIDSSRALEQAIHSYNNKLPPFETLHYYFNEISEPNETEKFFNNTLPGIINLALELPNVLPGSLPLLKQNHCKSISLSQFQISSLLANAFLCTYVWRKDMSEKYPNINFTRLYSSVKASRKNCVAQKIKCIIHYFERVLSNSPVGCVTFERKYVPRNQLPKWDLMEQPFKGIKLHISSTGIIEDCHGCLQVDFANKLVGGGVIAQGCVQEEIRFIICPELIISRLFTEELGDNEALLVIGPERYSDYTGYSDTFKWNGNVNDQTPYDEYGRRKTAITVIDATRFRKSQDQFQPPTILRELNKAYVGFSCREKTNIAPVASGNWGCGAFKGNVNLKFLIQLMACKATNRDLVYYSFGDTEMRDECYRIYLFLINNGITITNLWRYLCRFCANNIPHDQLYPYIQQIHYDLKSQLTIKQFFTFKAKKPISNTNGTVNEKKVKLEQNQAESSQASTSTSVENENPIIDESLSKEEEKEEQKKEEVKSPDKQMNSEHIISFIDMIDGSSDKKNNDNTEEKGGGGLLNEIDRLQRTNKNESVETPMEIDSEEIKIKAEPKKKITDYFKAKTTS